MFKELFTESIIKDNINEGFFSDMIAMSKLSKDASKLATSLQKVKSPEELPDVIREYSKKVYDLTNKANISTDMKVSFYSSFLGGIYKQVKEMTGGSGDQVKKFLEWSNDIFNIAQRAALGNEQSIGVNSILGFK